MGSVGQDLRFALRGLARTPVVTAVVVLVMFVLSAVGFGQTGGLVDVAGLLQRVAVVAAWAWLSAVAIREPSRRP